MRGQQRAGKEREWRCVEIDEGTVRKRERTWRERKERNRSGRDGEGGREWEGGTEREETNSQKGEGGWRDFRAVQ